MIHLVSLQNTEYLQFEDPNTNMYTMDDEARRATRSHSVFVEVEATIAQAFYIFESGDLSLHSSQPFSSLPQPRRH